MQNVQVKHQSWPKCLVAYKWDMPPFIRIMPSSLGGQLHCFLAVLRPYSLLGFHSISCCTLYAIGYSVRGFSVFCDVNCRTRDAHAPIQHMFNIQQLPICVGLAQARPKYQIIVSSVYSTVNTAFSLCS